MEQKTPTPTPADVQAARVAAASILKNRGFSPSYRFACWMAAHSLTDEMAAGLLLVSRPAVARIRMGRRDASQDLAARVEALAGIPAAHWADTPAKVLAQIAANRASLEKAARAAKPPRKAA